MHSMSSRTPDDMAHGDLAVGFLRRSGGNRDLRAALLLENETLVALGGDLGEALEVEGAAQMYTELAGLAWDVGPRVPGVGEGVERLVGERGDLSIPTLLCVG